MNDETIQDDPIDGGQVEYEAVTPEESAAPEPEEEKVPKSVQKRIDKAIWERSEARRDADEARAKVAAIELRLKELEKPTPPKESKTYDNGAPDPSKYESGRYDPDYLEALTDYKVELKIKEKEGKELFAQKQKEVVKLQQEAKELHADYDESEKTFFSHGLASVPQFQELLLDSENPAELSYYLGKNPQELDKLGAMNEAQAARYLGALEVKILNQSLEPTKKVVSNAPAPITPLGSAKSSSVVTDISQAKSMAEYVKLREAQRTK